MTLRLPPHVLGKQDDVQQWADTMLTADLRKKRVAPGRRSAGFRGRARQGDRRLIPSGDPALLAVVGTSDRATTGIRLSSL